MGLFAEFFSNFVWKQPKTAKVKSNHIFYKIVGANTEGRFTLQCINTNAIFYAKIIDIVFDIEILQGLHPIQSCFVGIEYAKHFKEFEHNPKNYKVNNINSYSLGRYGCYNLCYQNRDGEICFINQNTHNKFTMDPRDIALTEELITEFDSTQAFYIGLLAGLKMSHSTMSVKNRENKKPSLYLVK